MPWELVSRLKLGLYLSVVVSLFDETFKARFKNVFKTKKTFKNKFWKFFSRMVTCVWEVWIDCQSSFAVQLYHRSHCPSTGCPSVAAVLVTMECRYGLALHWWAAAEAVLASACGIFGSVATLTLPRKYRRRSRPLSLPASASPPEQQDSTNWAKLTWRATASVPRVRRLPWSCGSRLKLL